MNDAFFRIRWSHGRLGFKPNHNMVSNRRSLVYIDAHFTKLYIYDEIPLYLYIQLIAATVQDNLQAKPWTLFISTPRTYTTEIRAFLPPNDNIIYTMQLQQQGFHLHFSLRPRKTKLKYLNFGLCGAKREWLRGIYTFGKRDIAERS